MMVTLALTADQEAQHEDVDAHRLLHRLVDGALDQLAPPVAPSLRIPGLHRGRYQISDDFDAPFISD